MIVIFWNWQRFVVLLYPAGFSPHRTVTGIVEGADEILYEWNESCWGHCLLLEITCKRLPINDQNWTRKQAPTLIVIFLQSSQSDEEENYKEQERPDYFHKQPTLKIFHFYIFMTRQILPIVFFWECSFSTLAVLVVGRRTLCHSVSSF